MPKAIEDKLKKAAIRKGLKVGSDRFNRFVFGMLAKIEKRRRQKRK